MTRKQALMRVCGILAETEQNQEYIEIQIKLEELMADMPLTGWSNAAIFDTIDQWVYEHGRTPTTKELAGKGLPPIPVIKNRFGLTGKAFLNAYYPKEQPKCNSIKYGAKSKEEWMELFRSEFLRIQPFSAVKFNQNRKPELPTWATFAKIAGITTWVQLLTCCNISPISKEIQPCRRKREPLKTTSHVDILQRIDEMKDNR